MSIKRIHLKNANELSESLQKQGSDNFYLNFVKGREAFIGSNASVTFIKNFIEKRENSDTIFYEI